MHVGTGAIAFSLFIRHSHPCDRTAPSYSSSQLREVQSEKPNPQPLPFKGRGVRIKASLLVGERFGERSKRTASNRERLYTDYLFELRFVTEVEETYDEKWSLKNPDSYTQTPPTP